MNSRPVVSVVWNWSAVHEVGSLTLSAPEVRTVTSSVYQSFAPRLPELTERFADGSDLSSLMVTGVAALDNPASLIHEPVT